MLGIRLAVTVLGTISGSGVYSGYTYSQGKRINVIVISSRPVGETVYGTVIAVANEGTSYEKLVLSARSDELYEPQIRELLANVRSVKIDKLTCLYEKSCGAVICTKDRNDVKILLVKNHNGKYWSFPKGHVEKGETETDTAIREIKEETGLDVKLLRGFRETGEYSPYGKIKKKVVFFIGISPTKEVHIQQNEIDSSNWVTFSEASRICCYPNDLRVLDRAQEYLKTHKVFK